MVSSFLVFLSSFCSSFWCQLLLLLLLLTAIWLSPGGSGYLHVHKYEKKEVTRKFKSGGLHERHVVATWKLGDHLSIRL